MTITIDTGNVYVMLGVFFFAALFFVDVALKLKIVRQQQRLVNLKEKEASPQLEAALGIIEVIADQLGATTVFMNDADNRDRIDGLVTHARTIAAKLKRDAGL